MTHVFFFFSFFFSEVTGDSSVRWFDARTLLPTEPLPFMDLRQSDVVADSDLHRRPRFLRWKRSGGGGDDYGGGAMDMYDYELFRESRAGEDYDYFGDDDDYDDGEEDLGSGLGEDGDEGEGVLSPHYDDEDFRGVSSSGDEEKEEESGAEQLPHLPNGEVINVTVGDLQPCADYVFAVQNVYAGGARHPEASVVRGRTRCAADDDDGNGTLAVTAASSKTDEEPLADLAVEVEAEAGQVAVRATWKQGPGVRAKLQVWSADSGELVREEVKESAADGGDGPEMAVEQPVEFCRRYRVQLWKVVAGQLPNHQPDFQEQVTTPPNENRRVIGTGCPNEKKLTILCN